METKTIEIQNLKCHGCANTIITQLEKLEGIQDVIVNNDTNEVSFNFFTESAIDIAKQKLSSLGYPASDEANSLPKKAKSFVSCAVGRMNK